MRNERKECQGRGLGFGKCIEDVRTVVASERRRLKAEQYWGDREWTKVSYMCHISYVALYSHSIYIPNYLLNNKLSTNVSTH